MNHRKIYIQIKIMVGSNNTIDIYLGTHINNIISLLQKSFLMNSWILQCCQDENKYKYRFYLFFIKIQIFIAYV